MFKCCNNHSKIKVKNLMKTLKRQYQNALKSYYKKRKRKKKKNRKRKRKNNKNNKKKEKEAKKMSFLID